MSRNSRGRSLQAILLTVSVTGLAACEGGPETPRRIGGEDPGGQASATVRPSGGDAHLAAVSVPPPASAGVAVPPGGRGDSSGAPGRSGNGGAGITPAPSPTGGPGAAAGTDGADDTTPVRYADAERVFRNGDYVEAAELFGAYASRRPQNPWGHYMLGISAWRAGDHGRAEEALRRTVEVDPGHEKGLLNLARVLLEQSKASDALDHAEDVVEGWPEWGEGWRVLGNTYAELGLVSEAVDAYKEAIVLNPLDAWTMNNLGLLMLHEGHHREALRPLARATELRPEVALFQNNLGVALERTGHPVEAAVAFRAALEARPDYGKARVSLERVEARAAARGTVPVDLPALAGAFALEVTDWQDASFREDELDGTRR